MKPMKTLLVVGSLAGLTAAGVVVAIRFSVRRTGSGAPVTSAASWLRQRVPAPIRSRLGTSSASAIQGSADLSHAENRVGAAFVGNTQTRVYHQASDAHLPAEHHRVYFTSAEEAEATGYRVAGSIQ